MFLFYYYYLINRNIYFKIIVNISWYDLHNADITYEMRTELF